MQLRRLNPDLNGFTIAQFSDLHFGPYMRGPDAQQIAERINQLHADLTVFTGDFVTMLDGGETEPITEVFSGLRAARGVHAILGNHDHWTDAAAIGRASSAAGVTLLRNEGRLINAGRAGFWPAGVDDTWEERHDLNAALREAPRGHPVVLLAYEPDYADEVDRDGRVDVQLSGYSHGGQVRLPYFGAIALPHLAHKDPFGLRRLNSTWLYTNRGVGVLPPVRLNCRPEITLFELSVTGEGACPSGTAPAHLPGRPDSIPRKVS